MEVNQPAPGSAFKSLYLGHETLLNLTAQILGHLIQRATLRAPTWIEAKDGVPAHYPETAPILSPDLRAELVTEARALAQACIGAVEPNDQLQADLEGCQRELEDLASRLLRTETQRDKNAQARDAAEQEGLACDRRRRELEAEILRGTAELDRIKTELQACRIDKAQTVTALLTADRELARLRSYPPGPVMGTWREPLKGSGPMHLRQSHGGVGPCLNCEPDLNRVGDSRMDLIGPGACIEAPPSPQPPAAFTSEEIEKARAHLARKGKHCVHERPLGEPCGACGRGPITAAYFDGPQRPVPSHGAEPEQVIRGAEPARAPTHITFGFLFRGIWWETRHHESVESVTAMLGVKPGQRLMEQTAGPDNEWTDRQWHHGVIDMSTHPMLYVEGAK